MARFGRAFPIPHRRTPAVSAVVSGTATATVALSASATGTVKIAGTATATLSLSGLATGTVISHGPVVPPGPYIPTQAYQQFTYMLVDLRSGAPLGYLPFRSVSFGRTLNGVGQFQGIVDLQDPAMQQLDPADLTTTARTGLFVDYNGGLVWGGVIWPRQPSYDASAATRPLTVQASDLWSYFGRRVQATDYSSPPYSGLTGPSPNPVMPIWDASATDALGVYDPVLVAWQIVADALNIANGNILGGLGIAANSFTTAAGYLAPPNSGTPQANYININFPYSSQQSVETIVEQLASLGLGVGFDFGVDVAYSAGPFSVPMATLNFSYPRRGRTVDQNNLMVDLSTSRSYSFPEDGTQAANTIYESGASGALNVSENLAPIDQGWPILETVKSRSNLTTAQVQGLLAALGFSDLAQYSYPVVTPQFTIGLNDPNLQLGQFIEGDDIRVFIPGQANDGTSAIWDPWFPGGMDQVWRITQWTATVADQGDSTLQVSLNTPPTLSATEPPIT